MSNCVKQTRIVIATLAVALAAISIAAHLVFSPGTSDFLIAAIVILAGLSVYSSMRGRNFALGQPEDAEMTTRYSDLATCVDMVPAPAFVIDETHLIIACNNFAEKVFERSRYALEGLELGFSDQGRPHREFFTQGDDDSRDWWSIRQQTLLLAGHEETTVNALIVALTPATHLDRYALVVITPAKSDDMPSYEPVSISVQPTSRLIDDDKLLLRELNFDMRSRFQSALGVLDLIAANVPNRESQRYIGSIQKTYRETVDCLDSLVSFFELDLTVSDGGFQTFGLDELLNDVAFGLGLRKDIEENEVLFDTDRSVEKAIRYHKELLAKVIYHLVLYVVGTGRGKTVLIRVRLSDETDAKPVLTIEVLTKDQVGERQVNDIDLNLEIARRVASRIDGELYLGHQRQDYSGCLFQANIEGIDEFNSGLVIPAHLKNLQALIVDDNEASRAVFEQLTSALGWNVDVAASGEAAMHMIRFQQGVRKNYDVILIDWRMPGLDGWETSKQVRAMKDNGSTPIIVMISAHNRSFLSKNIEDRGRVLNGFLTKPVTLTMLLDAVADATAHVQEPVIEGNDPSIEAEPLAGNTVLVVDDNQMHREVAKEFLVRNGAKVHSASGGYEAISKVQNGGDQIDVVLMDVQMPDLNGYEACSRIRDLGYQDIPILMMTANNTSELYHKSLEAGANDVVIKPFVMREIASALSEHVGHARRSRRARAKQLVSVDVSQVAEALGFNTDVIDQHFEGRLSGYVKSLRTFVEDAKRFLKKIERVPTGRQLEDVVREIRALGGMMSIAGAPDDGQRAKQHAEELLQILSNANQSEAEQKAVLACVHELVQSRLSASERFLSRLEKDLEDV
ncbi:response regulator [Thalassospira sp. A40-3]|uniref:response regulator n=1 Tax=Thalassospira sp. A40-3 TaxID=2785908 RepID=UPI0018CE399C|nr:response regulator [Thalassospira sp. A40-3]QPO12907.1 response regulator [Thalassospira sp. A40-3]